MSRACFPRVFLANFSPTQFFLVSINNHNGTLNLENVLKKGPSFSADTLRTGICIVDTVIKTPRLAVGRLLTFEEGLRSSDILEKRKISKLNIHFQRRPMLCLQLFYPRRSNTTHLSTKVLIRQTKYQKDTWWQGRERRASKREKICYLYLNEDN